MVASRTGDRKVPGFDSRPVHCQLMTLGKLFTHICLSQQAVYFGTGQRTV